MRQFLLPESWPGEGPCAVEGRAARHLSRVLRLVPGDRLVAIDRDGARRDCELLESGPVLCLLRVGPPRAAFAEERLQDARGGRGGPVPAEEPTVHPRPSAPGADRGPAGEAAASIVLVQSVLKGPKMDQVLRQAAEAGVELVLPLLAARCVARPEEGSAPERWTRIVQEGLQQSGSPVLTRIAPPCALASLDRVLEGLSSLGEGDSRILRLVLHEEGHGGPSLHEHLAAAPRRVVLCVGPEGGFAPEETRALMDRSFLPLRLPGAVLRAETAALYGIAAVQIILAERAAWKPSP